jgi:hypothetical protein
MEGYNIPSLPQLSQYTINPPKTLSPDQFLNTQYSPSNFSITGGKKHTPAKNNKKSPPTKKAPSPPKPNKKPTAAKQAAKQATKKKPANKQAAKKSTK